MYIKPTKNAKNGSIFEVHERAYDMLLYSKGDDVPTPWDADISIEDGWVVLEGAMAPGGLSDRATCVCRVPIEYFSRYYELEVPNYLKNEAPDIVDAIKSAGWEIEGE